jgi:hypothetical protein
MKALKASNRFDAMTGDGCGERGGRQRQEGKASR